MPKETSDALREWALPSLEALCIDGQGPSRAITELKDVSESRNVEVGVLEVDAAQV